jgi:AAA domain
VVNLDLYSMTDPSVYRDLLRTRHKPPPVAATPEWVEETKLWIHLQYIPTPATEIFGSKVSRVQMLSGGQKRQWLALSGPATAGKTELLSNFLLDLAESTGIPWRTRVGDYTHVPGVYVKASGKQQGAGLLKSICRFCGIDESGHEDDLVARLMHLLPRLGTKVVLVDDAHNYRRVSDIATSLTDSLRNVITLPVTFVFSGVALHDSALLRQTQQRHHESTEQLRSRCTSMTLEPIIVPRDNVAYRHLVTAFGGRIRTIPGMRASGLSEPKMLLRLAQRCAGRPGAILGCLKDAAVLALYEDLDLSATMIEAALPDAGAVDRAPGAGPA